MWRAGALVLGMLLTARGGGAAEDCPVDIDATSWDAGYLWRHPTKGSQCYDINLTLVHSGRAVLYDVRVDMEVHDLISLRKPVVRLPEPYRLARFAPGERKRINLVLPRVERGDEVVLRISAALSASAPPGKAETTPASKPVQKASGKKKTPAPSPEDAADAVDDPSRLVRVFSLLENKAPVLNFPAWLDPSAGELRVLAQRLDVGRAGKKGTPMLLAVKLANLYDAPVTDARIHLTAKYAQADEKVVEFAKTFTAADDKKTIPAGGSVIRRFRFELPGELRGHSIRVESHPPAAPGANAENVPAPVDAEAGGALDDAFDDPKVPGVYVGRVRLVEDGVGRVMARYALRNTLPADHPPRVARLKLTALDRGDQPIKTYHETIERLMQTIPRGETVERTLPLPGADEAQFLTIEVSVEAP